MVLTESQWNDLCAALEMRSYRYYDEGSENEAEEEKALFFSIQKQIVSNKLKPTGKPASLRFTKEKKRFLADMVQERIGTEEESPILGDEFADNLKEIYRQLTGKQY